MPVYKYSGYDKSGLSAAGSIEADSRSDAVLKIKTKGIFPKEISETVSVSGKRFSRTPSPLVLATITRRLSTLISAGVTLVDAIGAISSEQTGIWKNILINVKESLAAGSSLARAMESHPAAFPGYYTGMVAAGESSGKLTEVLLKLADYLEKDINIKGKIKTALIYPAFMAFVGIFILIFLFTFVIPKISRIFEDSSAALPFITVILMWISTAFKYYWWLFIAIFAGLVIAYRRIRRTRKEIIDAVLLKDPTGTFMDLYMLRFTMTMGFLLSGGLPILRAMKLTGKAIGNVVLENRIVSAEALVSQGAKLSNSLENFPPTILQIISTGEQTGKLPEVLQKTSESYEAEFDRKLQRTISLLEPSLILLMGLIVGFIVIAILLPIFEMNEIIR